MKSPTVIRLEGWISFLIPFLSAVGGSALLADTFYGKVVTMICLALVGGLSGLKTFFSTTYSDSLPDAPPVAVTAPLMVGGGKPITIPNLSIQQPAATDAAIVK